MPAWAQQNLAWCAFYLGRAEEAEQQLRAAAAEFEELGDKAGRGWALGLLAWTRFQQGHAAEAGAMAEEVIDEIRDRGDRWATGMMLVLIGSVRLWTGRPQAAIPILEEAREHLVAIDDAFGILQASAHLGRALVCVGRVAEGFAVLPAGDGEIPEGFDREQTFALMATINAAVQVGDTDLARALLLHSPPTYRMGGEEVLVGDTERAVATGLHKLQEGDPSGAVQVLESMHRQLDGTRDPNAMSALALVRAADGNAGGALAVAGEVLADDKASHLDRVFAGIAQSIALESSRRRRRRAGRVRPGRGRGGQHRGPRRAGHHPAGGRDRGIGPWRGRRRVEERGSGSPPRRAGPGGDGVAPGVAPGAGPQPGCFVNRR